MHARHIVHRGGWGHAHMASPIVFGIDLTPLLLKLPVNCPEACPAPFGLKKEVRTRNAYRWSCK